MKALKQLLSGVVLFTCSLAPAQAQEKPITGTPPPWGPAGYNNVRYYYLPDIYTYYDISTAEFIYIADHRWVRTETLPHACRDYNLYSSYKVVLTDYSGDAPFVYFKKHKEKYPVGYQGRPQKAIGRPPVQVKEAVADKN